MSPYAITIYCPDSHLAYDPDTPERIGVGGGVTMRIRLARALARRGHDVTLVGNCVGEHRVDGVHHVPVGDVRRIVGDAVVFTSSGGPPSFRPMASLDVDTRVRIGWVHGVPQPDGIQDAELDHLCTVSNFIRAVVRDEWQYPGDRVAVIYNGVERAYVDDSAAGRVPERNRHRLVVSAKPGFPLDAAVAIFQRLRAADSRFELHVFGGAALWGMQDTTPVMPQGANYYGTVGQRELAAQFRMSGFLLNLQLIREGFGLTAAEAMAAGCLPLVCRVGAYPEVVVHGRNGWMLDGDPQDERVQAEAADIVASVVANDQFDASLRAAAKRVPWDMDLAAAAWEGHIAWSLGDRDGLTSAWMRGCPECGGQRYVLADGYHCATCGRFSRAADGAW